MAPPQVPTTQSNKRRIYDFLTDASLVPQIIGYRQTNGFTVLTVDELTAPGAKATDATYVTGFNANGFPAGPALAIPAGTHTAWVVVSEAG